MQSLIYIFISDILIRIAGRRHSTHCVPLDMLSRGGRDGHGGLDKRQVFVCTLVVKAEGGSTSTGNIYSSTVLLKTPTKDHLLRSTFSRVHLYILPLLQSLKRQVIDTKRGLSKDYLSACMTLLLLLLQIFFFSHLKPPHKM